MRYEWEDELDERIYRARRRFDLEVARDELVDTLAIYGHAKWGTDSNRLLTIVTVEGALGATVSYEFTDELLMEARESREKWASLKATALRIFFLLIARKQWQG